MRELKTQDFFTVAQRIFLFSLIFIFQSLLSCSDKNGQDLNTDFSKVVVQSEPLNEQGLLEFAIFSNSSSANNKVFEGSDDLFNYFGYGESILVENSGSYIPKNIKNISQYDPESGVINHIELDENLIPIKFYSAWSVTELDTIFYVEYNESATTIVVETKNAAGVSTIIDTITLGGFSSGKVSDRLQSVNADCSNPFPEANSFDICSSGNIYESYANEWKNLSKYTIIKNVGKTISWFVNKLKTLQCPDQFDSRIINSKFTCSDYKVPNRSYIKFLDSGEYLNFDFPLGTYDYSYNPICANYRGYKMNVDVLCNGLNGDNEQVVLINFVDNSTNMFSDNFLQFFIQISGEFYSTYEGSEMSIIENESGIFLNGNFTIIRNTSPRQIVGTRPVEIVFRY